METGRRHFLKTTAATAALAAFHQRASGAAPAGTIHELKTISQQPAYYYGWPTVVRIKNGDLLLVCSGGRESHVCPFGRVELMRSPDGGKSWSSPRVVLDGPIDDRDAGILETSKGTILITTFTSLAYEQNLARQTGEAAQRWNAAQLRCTAVQRQQALGLWMIRSTDGGVNFSGRYPVPVNSPHGPAQLSDGRLLYAGKALWAEEAKVGVCESLDDGVTWTWLADIPTRAGDDPSGYHELHAVENKDGTIIVQIRNHNVTNASETLQCESSDGGKTWTDPHSIGVWGMPSQILLLRDGRLLMSYGYRRKPFGNQARLSDDGGKTWSEPITISADGIGGDLGYPSTVELDDGSLITIWYEKMASAPKAVLRQARWSLG